MTLPFRTHLLLGRVPDADVNRAILSRTAGGFRLAPQNHAGPDIVKALRWTPHRDAAKVYAGCQRATTLQSALETDPRISVQAAILLNPHLPWDANADRTLERVPNYALGRAVAQGGWKNPALYDDTRGHLTDRLRTLPDLVTYLFSGTIGSCLSERRRHGAPQYQVRCLAFIAMSGRAETSTVITAARAAAHVCANPPTDPHQYGQLLQHTPARISHDWDLSLVDPAGSASQAAWDRLGGNTAAWVLLSQMIDEWGGTFGDLLDTAAAIG